MKEAYLQQLTDRLAATETIKEELQNTKLSW